MRHVCNLIVLLLVTAPLAHAQADTHAAATVPEPRLRFHRLTTEDGLSSNEVETMLQDRLGFIWIGTSQGLNRYDGYEFRVYRANPDDPRSLSHPFINILFEDDEGVLWVGTDGGGLNRYDRATDSFTHYVHDPDNPKSLNHNVVQGIYEDRAGTLWIGTVSGINRLDRRTNTFFRMTPPAVSNFANMNGWGHVFLEDRRGTLWMGSGGAGVFRFDPGREVWEAVPYDPVAQRAFRGNWINDIQEDSSGALWLGVGSGLYRKDPMTGTFTRVDLTPPGEAPDLHNDINGVYLDQDGSVWVGTWGKGIKRYDPQTGSVEHFLPDPQDANSLSYGYIRSVFRDRQGVLWVATRGRGVCRMEPSINVRTHRVIDPAFSLGSDQFVSSFYEDRMGFLWVGSAPALCRYDPRSEKSKCYQVIRPEHMTALGSVLVREDQQGVLWAGTSIGLYQFDREQELFTRYAPDPSALDSPDNLINVVYDDRQGSLWVGSAGGLHRFDPQIGGFEHFHHDPADPTSLRGGSVVALHEDQEGVLWVGTSIDVESPKAGTLNRFDRRTGTFTHYEHEPGNSTSLSGSDLRALYEDPRGVLWVATFGGGLNGLGPDRRSFTRFTEENSPLPSNFITGLTGDAEGNLWIATGKGLSRFNPEVGTWRHLGSAHGLYTMVRSPSGLYRNRSGKLFVGGAFGYSFEFQSFSPGDLSDNVFSPQVVLTGLRLFGKPVQPGPGAPLDRQISVADRVTLAHAQNDVTFEFAGLHFEAPEQNRYAYMLENYDSSWREESSIRTATYTNLSPGVYVFRVKAASASGVWNEEGTSIHVVVLPPWWRTWWAYMLYGLLFAAGVFAIDRLQRRRLIRRERTRAEREADKLRAEAAEAWTNYLQSENQRQTQELDQARHLQLSMLPERVPEHPTVEIAAHMKTATEVGGDYYDFDLSDDGTLTIIIGDATGHGASAGTMVTATKGILNVLSGEEDLEQVLMAASEAVRRMHLPKLYMALALVRLRDHTLELAGAGMPPALVYRAASGCIEEVALKGLPLGSPSLYSYKRQCVLLSAGDTVVLMSDGFPELFGASGQRLGYERMAGLFAEAAGRSPEKVIAHLMETAKAWCNGQVPDDDMTFVVMKVKA